jgi:hypothetical protein
MSAPAGEPNVDEQFRLYRQAMELDFTRGALRMANGQCFRRCFRAPDNISSKTNGSNSNNNSKPTADATPIAGDMSSTQQQCMRHCLENFMEARKLVADQAVKHQ